MRFRRPVENLIADLRGVPTSNSRMFDRGSKPLDSLVEVCLEKYKIGQETPEEIILRHWPRIVGERNAARCRPLRIDQSQKLHIGVPNPILRREFQFHEDRIMTALRSIEGCQHLTGLVYRAG
jgi:hypothetical protein